MKTDRELLELAAKAAGIDGWWESAYLSFILRAGGPWRPIADDGDEARLEAKLGLDVQWGDSSVVVSRGDLGACEPYGSDKQAARRLAGVRAAAAIGEAMP